jgi:hypothetical protein
MPASMRWLPEPAPGTKICLGFDGSDSDDWTAIKAETIDGLLFTPRYGPDSRPTIWNPTEWNGKIPRSEVHVAVGEIFDRFEVARMYCDPPDYRSEIGDWALEHGEDHVFEWATFRGVPMHAELERFLVDLQTGRLTHDGCPLTTINMLNAVKIARRDQRYVLGKPAQHQKIDIAMSGVLAHAAASDAHEDGWTLAASSGRISHTMYGFS